MTGRKNKKIYDYFDYWLNRLEECYKKDEEYDNFKECFDHIIAFANGCCLADGIKWNKRLNKRFSDWLDSHQDIIKQHRDRALETNSRPLRLYADMMHHVTAIATSSETSNRKKRPNRRSASHDCVRANVGALVPC